MAGSAAHGARAHVGLTPDALLPGCWGRHINDYRQAWDAVRRADHPQVGLILHTFHALARKCPIEEHSQIFRLSASSWSKPPTPPRSTWTCSPQPPLPLLPRPGRAAVVAMMQKLVEIGSAGLEGPGPGARSRHRNPGPAAPYGHPAELLPGGGPRRDPARAVEGRVRGAGRLGHAADGADHPAGAGRRDHAADPDRTGHGQRLGLPPRNGTAPI